MAAPLALYLGVYVCAGSGGLDRGIIKLKSQYAPVSGAGPPPADGLLISYSGLAKPLIPSLPSPLPWGEP